MAKTRPSPTPDPEQPLPDAEEVGKPALAEPLAVTLAEHTAGPGDAVVWVVSLSGEFQRCYARAARARQIVVDGHPCEHIGEGPDGAWLYGQRAF